MKNTGRLIAFIFSLLAFLFINSLYIYVIWQVIRSDQPTAYSVIFTILVGGAAVFVLSRGLGIREEIQHYWQILRPPSLFKTGKPVIPQSLQTKQAMGIQMIKGKYFLMEQFPLVFTFSFLVLSSIISLFPPFYWGEDMIQYRIQKLNISIPDYISGSEIDRNTMEYRVNRELPILQIELPIKQHSFLFGDNKKWFDIPTPPEKLSTPLRFKLNRRLIISETLLSYVLAFALSGVLQFLFMLKRKS